MKRLLLLLSLFPLLVLADPFDNVYPVEVTRVVDADTFDANISLGFTVSVFIRIRVMQIDTPETWRPETRAEWRHGVAATKRAKELLEVEGLTATHCSAAVYNRIQCDIILPDGTLYADTMKTEGFEKKPLYEDPQ